MRIKKKILKYSKYLYIIAKFIFENILTILLGAVMATIISQSYFSGYIIFGILIFVLAFYFIVLIVNEHRISVIAIMKQSIKSHNYLDAIKYGCSILPVLASANESKVCIRIGEEVLKTIDLFLQENEFGENYNVEIEGNEKIIALIRVEILIDTLGWGEFTADSSIAKKNIIEGMEYAREYLKRMLTFKLEDNFQYEKIFSNEKTKNQFISFAKILMKGYRHLSVICQKNAYDLTESHFIDAVISYLFSRGKIVDLKDCSHGNRRNICFPFIKGDTTYTVNDFLSLIESYFLSDCQFSDNAYRSFMKDFYNVPNFLQTDIIKTDFSILQKILTFDKNAYLYILREQCYAWARDIVKDTLYNLNKNFMSNEELLSRSNQAKAFALFFVSSQTDSIEEEFFIQYGRLALCPQEEKKILRFMSLVCEICLIDCYGVEINEQGEVIIGNVGTRIAELISKLKTVIGACRYKRHDLFIRCYTHYVYAEILRYNLLHRYALESRSDKATHLERFKKSIRTCKKEILEHEVVLDDTFQIALSKAKSNIKQSQNEFHQITKIKKHKNKKIKKEDLFSINLKDYYACATTSLLEDIKRRWIR